MVSEPGDLRGYIQNETIESIKAIESIKTIESIKSMDGRRDALYDLT